MKMSSEIPSFEQILAKLAESETDLNSIKEKAANILANFSRQDFATSMKDIVNTVSNILPADNNSSDPNRTAIVITASRRINTITNTPVSIKKALKCTNPVELTCSRLAKGALANKRVSVWHDPKGGGRNRRAKRLVGFDINGSVVIVCHDMSITETDFLELEKLITNEKCPDTNNLLLD